ncbi:hypothetical protein RRG08_004876 [Elysia crispata]|uniref:Uncharacterized protein n=1 Tax=Elysia crispata TaxID=231223 RepID=A0AAE1B6H9_9GAST|nr:hypothetical protein RRG08_004876 [Elysia crispata]
MHERLHNFENERQAIYPEYSKLLPEDDRCKPTTFNKEEACRLLKGATIHVAGDSFVREMYIALAILLSGDDVAGALRKDLTVCKIHTLNFTSRIDSRKVFHLFIEYSSILLKRFSIPSYGNAKNVNMLWEILKDLHNRPKSFLVLGLGIHDNFNAELIKSAFLKPLASHTQESQKYDRNLARCKRITERHVSAPLNTN